MCLPQKVSMLGRMAVNRWAYPFFPFSLPIFQFFADLNPGSGAFLTPGAGMELNPDPWSGMNIPDHISKKKYWKKYIYLYPKSHLRFFVRIRNPNPLVRGMDPRIRIRTKMSRIRKTVTRLVPEQNVSVVDSCIYKCGQIFGFVSALGGNKL
jgi:hypothetical protein